MSSRRSASEITKLVQNRVKERDLWKIHGRVEGTHPPPGIIFHSMDKNLFGMQHASQEELDHDFPVQALDWNKLEGDEDSIRVSWLGHASMLVQMKGFNFLTDPVFSQRCSPSQWIGPKRHRQPPCTLEDLCEIVRIDAVLISHNHYDHLDYFSCCDILRFCSGKPAFVVPLGLQHWFQSYTDADDIRELDWHETTTINNTHITGAPARHWSNRVGDRDRSLWCGYAVESIETKKRFFYPGDTAWFDDLTEIGKKYGPFDVAAIPIGAYEPRNFMRYYHINPEEAVLMKDAIQAKCAVPFHYGTFPLTIEPITEPACKLEQLMKDREDSNSFQPWLIGETRVFAR